METKRFNLKQLLDHFSDIGEKRWGTTLKLGMLENVFKPIKNGKEVLSLKHIEALRNDFAFLRWWKIPELSKDDFNHLKGVFIVLKPRDKDVIGKLFELLKNIEIVSCVLRFIDPENYGILSPPVENILNIKGKHQTEKYLNYLSDLEELKEEYDFERIADVDMTLWALANIMNYSMLRHHPVYSNIYEEYEQTANPVKIIMARNSLEQIKKEKPLYKAKLFLDSDYVTSGLIAGRELDLFTKELCNNNRIKRVERKEGRNQRYLSIPEIAERLSNIKIITKEEEGRIKVWWNIRCDLTHEHKISATFDDVKKMIDGISKLRENFES